MAVDTAQAIKDFINVRDKPYHLDVESPMFGCNCYTKALDLQESLEKLSYQTRIMICYFDWRESPIPTDILKLYDHSQETTHAWLQVRSNSFQEWQDVDPTWDAPLAKYGFQIAKWDGLGCTSMAVLPKFRMSFEEGRKYLEKSAQDTKEDNRYRKENKAFFVELSRWMEDARNAQ
jgi:hypothetical protein